MAEELGSIHGSIAIGVDGTSDLLGLNSALGALTGAFLTINPLTIGLTAGIAGLSLVAYGLGSAISSSVDAAEAFEFQMTRNRALLGATDEEFSRLDATVQELGATTQYTALEIAQATEFLAMAGLNAADSIAILPDVLALATAGNLDLAQAADIVTNIMAAYRVGMDQSGHVNNVLAGTITNANVNMSELAEAMKYIGPIATDMGISLEETAAAVGLLGNAGIKGSQAGTSLRSGLLRLLDPSKKGKALMSELGIEVADAEGNIKSLNEILLELGAGLAGLSQADRVTALNELVGLRASASFSVLIEGAGQGDLAEFTTALENDVTQAADIAAQQLDTLKGDFDLLNSAIEGAKLQIGNEWLPVWRDVVQWMTHFVGDITPELVAFFGYLADAAENALPTIRRLVSEGFSGLRSFFTDMAAAYDEGGLEGVFNMLLADLQTLWNEQIYPTLEGWAIDFWNWLDLAEATGPDNLNSLLDSITGYLNENWPTIETTLDEWSEMFWDWVAKASEAVGEKLAPVLDNLQAWASSDDARTRVNTLGETISGILFDSLQLSLTNQDRANMIMFDMASALVEAAASLVPRLVELGELLATSILDGFIQKLTGFDAGPYVEAAVHAFSPIGQIEDIFNFLTGGEGQTPSANAPLPNAQNNTQTNHVNFDIKGEDPPTIAEKISDALRDMGFLSTQDLAEIYTVRGR